MYTYRPATLDVSVSASHARGMQIEPINEVRLVGRVSASPQSRTLPSGDVVVLFRLIVSRGRGRRPAGPRVQARESSDVIECATWNTRLGRQVASLDADEVVEVTGALRRRFSREGARPVSWLSVELDGCRTVSDTTGRSQ